MNIEEYLEGMHRVIRENFQTNDSTGGMPVAKVALLVNHSLPENYRSFGFEKFKDALRVLEEQKAIRLGFDSKGAFSLWLAEPLRRVVACLPTPGAFRSLRKDVWFAFVASLPAGHRFLNRKTGQVRVGVSSPLQPADEWIEFSPISQEVELDAARRFVEANGLDGQEIRDALQSHRWYVEFGKALSANSPLLASQWNRERSRRIIDIVQCWCKQNGIDEETVFQSGPVIQPIESKTRSSSEANQLRYLLLASIDRLSTEEVLNLHLPARCLVEVLRPDLLK
jgi:hypothetical protein